jgi:hypothetical protein
VNHGRTVFAQLVELLPRKAFDLAVRRYNGQQRIRALSCMNQLLCMIFAQLTARASLRETVCCLEAMGSSRYHCGIRGSIAKSTLADANERRDYRIFRDVALAISPRPASPCRWIRNSRRWKPRSTPWTRRPSTCA